MARGRRLGCRCVAALSIAAITIAPDESRAAERCERPVAHVVSIQGQVERRPGEPEPWRAATLGEALCVGDSIRVGRLSRAALALADDSVLRLDQRTTLRLRSGVEPQVSVVDLLLGALYLFARRPRALEVDTPFVNAGVEGTEFLVRVADDRTLIMVFDGRVLARNPDGELLLASGDAGLARAGEPPRPELVARPRDAVVWTLYYPPILSGLAGGPAETVLPAGLAAAVRLVQANDYAGALAALDAVPEAARGARYWTYRAGVLLNVGGADEAGAAIEGALARAPDAGEPLAQRAIIELAQNRTADALRDARRAVELSPDSAPALIALSYALQGNFELEEARETLREAVERIPDDPLLWARLAELELSFGDLDAAEEAAEQAVALAPDLARTQLVLGFAHLTRIGIEKARVAFEQAIALESANPLSRLGLGLARIREGDLQAGRREIEIAAGLDPDDALLRSYLGKAYFEEKRDPLAGDQFRIAKQLDPNDPTPWLYDAIRKQSENRPIEALHDLQTSIRLNDNRAPYRSRLLLDQDLATRGVSLARIYDDLGFDQIAVTEAAQSLSVDPSNWSAHRFLSDAYAQLPRHEIARVSELLQAQLLQPININPVQPSLAVSDLNTVAGIGPAEAAFNEFHPLFERNRVQLTATGVVGNGDGNENTLGDELVASGLWDRYSFSAGQFHFQTEGFRPNNDLETDLYDVFGQVAVTSKLNLQAEYRHRDTEHGDLRLRFDPENFFQDRRRVRQDTIRAGVRYTPAPHSTLLASLVYSDLEESQDLFLSPTSVLSTFGEDKGYQAEAQYLFQADQFDAIAGGGIYDVDTEVRIGTSPTDKFPTQQHNAYVYSDSAFPDQVTWTVGLSYDVFDQDQIEIDKVNPKIGAQWQVTDKILLRAAAFRILKRALVVDQTIEPTQIAGFNQFFDDINGTTSWRYGVGLDVALGRGLYVGAEVSRRDLEVPLSGTIPARFEDQREHLYRAYFYFTPHVNWAVRIESRLEKLRRDPATVTDRAVEIRTISVPFTIGYFSPAGFFAEVGPNYVRQDVELSPLLPFDDDSDDFILLDAAVGYRLPSRRGIISLEARNLWDKAFLFHNEDIQASTPSRPRFIPDRTVLLRGTLNF